MLDRSDAKARAAKIVNDARIGATLGHEGVARVERDLIEAIADALQQAEYEGAKDGMYSDD